MKIELLPEPEVEFAESTRHVDPRFGILNHGPVDRGTERALTELRVGIVGTAETIEKVERWMTLCAKGVSARESKQPTLFPRFPGFGTESPFGAKLVMHSRLQREVPRKALVPIIGHASAPTSTASAVEVFLDAARAVCEEGPPPHVVVCAPPYDLLDALESANQFPADEDGGLDESEDADADKVRLRRPAFHDLLKARALGLACPIQMVRERTYDPELPKARRKGKSAAARPTAHRLQDDATRAWNFFTALYHKAGGSLWRLARAPTDFATCYVGTSFFYTRDSSKVMASVAQVFNERGDGMIVRGAQAQIDKDDRQPHLGEADSRALMLNALQAFRDEHKTSPARVVLHKTSSFSAAEIEGLTAAAAEQRIELIDLVWVRRSWTRLFRERTYPPLRGTWLRLDDAGGIIYLRGSVPFFATYPGLYVPRPLEYACARLSSSDRGVAEELLALSKLNWNNTQFDGGEPITVRAARRVGDIMKNVPNGHAERVRFKYLM